MSDSNKLLSKIETLLSPLAQSLNLNIWGIEFLSTGRTLLRVYVEGEQGVNIEQCAELSRLAGLTLDVENIISGSYSLEISSPGLERPFFYIDQLNNYIGQVIRLSLITPDPTRPLQKKYQGILQKIEEPNLTLLLDDAKEQNSEIIISWNNVQSARLVHDFEQGKGKKRTSTKARS